MAILIKSHHGTFFHGTLLGHIKLGNDDKIMPILGNVNPCELAESNGTTLLHYAALYGNEKFAKQLIDLGFNIDVVNHAKSTPLMYAVEANQEATVRVLLEAGADIFVPDAQGQCALGKAFKNSKKIGDKILKALLSLATRESSNNKKGSPVNNIKNPLTGESVFIEAVEELSVETVKLLLERGADVNAKKKDGLTALYRAVQKLSVEKIKLLLEWGANANAQNPHNGQTALHLAVENRSLAIVKLLLERGANVDAKNLGNRQTALHLAVEKLNVEIVKLLLERGANVNAKNRNGETVLHRAVKKLNVGIVKLLLERGADVNARNIQCETPLECIDKFHYDRRIPIIVKALLDADTTLIDQVSPVEKLLSRGSRDIVRMVLQYPINFQLVDVCGEAALHHLAKNPHPDILEELRDRQFNVNFRCHRDKTMLHYAARRGNVSSIRFLLDHGADINARDFSDLSPLYTIIDSTMHYLPNDESVQKYRECVELLLERGADCENFSSDNYVVSPLTRLFYDDIMAVMDPVLSHIAVNVASGQANSQTVSYMIYSHPDLSNRYDLYRRQIEEVKGINVDETLSLIDFLTMSEQQISLYARHKRIVPDSKNIMKRCSLDGYPKLRLEKRFSKFAELVGLRIKVAETLNKIFEEFWNVSVYNIAEIIVSKVEDQYLYKMI